MGMQRVVGIDAWTRLLIDIAIIIIVNTLIGAARDLYQPVQIVVGECLCLRCHACAGQQVARPALETEHHAVSLVGELSQITSGVVFCRMPEYRIYYIIEVLNLI